MSKGYFNIMVDDSENCMDDYQNGKATKLRQNDSAEILDLVQMLQLAASMGYHNKRRLEIAF